MNDDVSLVGDRPEIIQPFLCALFREFDEKGVLWAVMRGWERLPQWTRYDVDILVARNDEHRAVSVVKKVAVSTRWKVYGVLRQGLMHSIWMLHNEGEGHSYLRIDIETGNAYRGIEIHGSQKYLQDRIRERCFWRMPVGYAGACVLLKQLAVEGCVEAERRRNQIVNGLSDAEFEIVVRDALQDVALSDALIMMIRARDWNGVKALGQKVRKRLFRLSPCRIFAMTGYLVELIWLMMRPYMRMLVVIVGPDGCGKTTIADAIERRFKGRPFQGVMRIHMLFGVPRMRTIKALAFRMIGKQLPPLKKEVPGTRHCGMQKPHSWLRAMGYVTYYGLGMICGRLKLLFWRPQGGLILADRFFQDYYYMRGYMNCPKWYVKMMEVFAPTPNLIISLERPAEAIYAQKPELDIVEIKREQEEIRRYIGHRNNARIVDAGSGLEATIKRVNAEIEMWLEHHV